ncbi:MAG: hypothetical protein Q8M88_02045 [Phenylobacterium sp.]|uniref:hypothetical protein n=1 Tax=Phenylobacterium sp. TaxID=1871053 RepID=UPI0027368646|nr:hypothetical protein [Phenylobacterium sp.]MDP3173200.1 hypothetical protein [Phenylobacterium sp.]
MTRRSLGKITGYRVMIALAVVVGLLAWWAVTTGENTKARRQGLAYVEHCATAFVAAKPLALGLQGADVNMTPPEIMAKGAPTRIQCNYTARSGEVGALIVDVACADPLDPRCRKIVAVVTPDGEGGYRAK